MIPREILKKIRHIDIRTNRIVTETISTPPTLERTVRS